MLKLTVGDWHKVSKPSSWCLIEVKLAKGPCIEHDSNSAGCRVLDSSLIDPS